MDKQRKRDSSISPSETGKKPPDLLKQKIKEQERERRVELSEWNSKCNKTYKSVKDVLSKLEEYYKCFGQEYKKIPPSNGNPRGGMVSTFHFKSKGLIDTFDEYKAFYDGVTVNDINSWDESNRKFKWSKAKRYEDEIYKFMHIDLRKEIEQSYMNFLSMSTQNIQNVYQLNQESLASSAYYLDEELAGIRQVVQSNEYKLHSLHLEGVREVAFSLLDRLKDCFVRTEFLKETGVLLQATKRKTKRVLVKFP